MRRASAAVAALALVAAAAALAAPGGPAGYENPKLFATVGPGASIVVRDGAGNRVTQVEPGTYDVVVNDLAAEHNFHLTGPGFDRFTSVEGTGQETWTVTLTAGEYRYLCDPHASVMRSSFTVGGGQPPASPPPPPPAGGTKLVGTVGPGFTISLRTPAGRTVKSLKAGRYAITVRDRASNHNFHLVGAGVNRKTGVAYRGTTTKAWAVRLKKGTLRWLCDPHATQMRGSAKVG
jgi:plastocyanin